MAIINLPGIKPSVDDLLASIPIGISPIGTPVYDDLTFDAHGWVNKDETEIFKWDQLNLQSVAISVAQSSNSVKKATAGRDGTIKTHIAKGDYIISINAVLSELVKVYPADQLAILKKITEAKVSVPITCKFLNTFFDIKNVVIDNITTAQKQGSIETVNVSMSLSSDNDFNPNDFEIVLK